MSETGAVDRDRFVAAALQNPVNAAVLDEVCTLALPDAWIVSGCLAQTVWNVLTDRPPRDGILDYDVFYFDPDASWEAQDAVIGTLHGRMAGCGGVVEARNQARVHLWYPSKHGLPYAPLGCACEGIDRFLTRNTQVGIRRTRAGHQVYAPRGFDDIFSLVVRPNPTANFSATNNAAKAARWKGLWPELTVLEPEARASPPVSG